MRQPDLKADGNHLRLKVEPSETSLLPNIPGLGVGNGYCVGPIDAVAVACKRLGIALPPRVPWNGLYPAHTSFSLYDYQKRGLSWMKYRLTEAGAVVLADDMGLGKTVQSIALSRLMQAQRVLVVAPRSVCLTWDAQVRQWLKLEPYLVPTGKHAKSVPVDSQFVVCSYALAGDLNPEYLPDFLILDEAHLLRGRKSKRSKRLMELSAMCDYRVGLTGTPMWDRPRDFFMLLHILFRNRLGNSWDFDHAYCGTSYDAHNAYNNKGVSRSDELKLRLSYYMLRREKHEVALQLPELRRQVVWLPPVEAASNKLRAYMLKQATAGEALAATLDSKVEAACERAADARRFLLLTWTRRHAHAIHEMLVDEYETPNVLITGEMTPKQRQAAVTFALKHQCGIVATIDSTGQGVDGIQHVADVGIFHALDWTPLKLMQAEARLHRIGQRNTVQWQYLVCRNSMDEFVVKTVVEKLDQWRGIMGQHSNRAARDALADMPSDAELEKNLYDAIAEGGIFDE